MESALPFVGMIVVQVAQVGLMVIGKEAIATGMSNFSYVCYSNTLASLVLLPSSLLVHKSSNSPPLSFSLLSQFLLLGILGFLMQVVGYAGITYASATLASAMLNLIPGFTFVLAIFFGMKTINCGSIAAQAKSIGTAVSVAGAIIVTLYKGPIIITAPLHSLAPHHLLVQPSDWIIGGMLLAIDCIFSAMFVIAQALILKKYPAVLNVMFSYAIVVAILSGLVSLIIEGGLSAFSLQPKMRLIAVLYSGFFGSAFQVTIGAWCVKRKGPLFVVMFQPLGIVIATAMGVMFLADSFYLGSLVGSIVIIIGFYSVMWGKAKEETNGEPNSKLKTENIPLLQDNIEEQNSLLIQ